MDGSSAIAMAAGLVATAVSGAASQWNNTSTNKEVTEGKLRLASAIVAVSSLDRRVKHLESLQGNAGAQQGRGQGGNEVAQLKSRISILESRQIQLEEDMAELREQMQLIQPEEEPYVPPRVAKPAKVTPPKRQPQPARPSPSRVTSTRQTRAPARRPARQPVEPVDQNDDEESVIMDDDVFNSVRQ